MEVWLSYSLTDLLMFSPEAYYRLFELHNANLWPAQPVAALAGLSLLLLVQTSEPRNVRWAMGILAMAWAAVGWWFLYERYGAINLAASWFAIGFALEALLLTVAVGLPLKERRIGPSRYPGLALMAYALLIHPLIGPLTGRAWGGVELFALAPDPTALATLGVLLLFRGWMPRTLSAIPIVWCLISGLTHWVMEESAGLLTPVIALLAITAAALSQRYQDKTTKT